MKKNEKTFDLVSMGDLMIDFSCIGKSEAGRLLFERNPGGAPMNVAAQLQRLGGRAGVISCVGEDEHGEYLYKLARDELGFDVTNLQFTREVGTRCLFVYFDKNNDRSFTNYKSPRSDLMIDGIQLDLDQLRRCKVFNYTPLSFELNYPIAKAATLALEAAAEGDALTSFDANYRFPYEDRKVFDAVSKAIHSAQIVKLTLEELHYFLHQDDVFKAIEELLNGNARIVALTMGSCGCLLCNRRGWVYQPTYDVPVLDTTGAGDSFMGSLIYALTREGSDVDAMIEDQLMEIANFCNACSSASTMQRGSLLVMPDQERVQQVMRNVPKIEMTLEQAIVRNS